MLVRVGEYIATSGIQSLIINFGSTYANWTVQFAYIHTMNQNLAANLKNKGDMICQWYNRDGARVTWLQVVTTPTGNPYSIAAMGAGRGSYPTIDSSGEFEFAIHSSVTSRCSYEYAVGISAF